MAGGYSLGVAQGAIVIAYDGAGVAKAQAQVGALEAKTKASGAGMAAAGKTMAKTGAIIAGGLAIAVHSASEFQSKMNLLVTAAGESPKAIGLVSSGIKNIAVQTGTSLDQLSEGMYTVEKAGYRAGAGLGVLKAAAEGAKAENVDLGTFTGALTSVMTSYSYKASDATRVTNMLVTAAGRSKTTMQEFAGSLATVLPIASALHISFAQVSGAMSVLTQHGTSARESTQELANLIRNLAGQNNVAKASLEQLGVNVIDLQKNFGKRGLTGTLDVVTAALAKHGKAGMIVTSALKSSATATSSLDTMMKNFHGTLLSDSKGLLDGSVSIGGYQKSAKSLGGTQGAMALQFLSLFKQSKGFSNQLKSGNTTVATLASTLQKAMGGATGLRTALQLGAGASGEATNSAKLLSENVNAISASYHHGGKDIETWAKTQKTASVQFGRLKAAGEVFAVNLGATVLPAIVMIVKSLTGLIHFLSSIPAPLQHILGISALVVAAFLLLGATIIKLVGFTRKLIEATKAIGGAFQGAYKFIVGMAEKLGLMTSAEAAAAREATVAARAQEIAAERVALAYEESVAQVEAAEAELEAALEAEAAVAEGSADEIEQAAARVGMAQQELAAAAEEAEARVSAAERALATTTANAAQAAERAAAATKAADTTISESAETTATAVEGAKTGENTARAGAATAAEAAAARIEVAEQGAATASETAAGEMEGSQVGVGAAFAATATEVETSAAGMATAVETASTEVETSVGGIGAAAEAAAAEVGAAFSTMGASAATGAAEVETAAVAAGGAEEAAGAASGAAFGPIGLAITAIGTGALIAAQHFHLFGGSAKDQIKPTDDFTSAIKRDNGALGENTRALVENKLEKSGAYDAALKLGVGQKTLTDAMMGNKDAMGQVAAAQRMGLNPVLRDAYGLTNKQIAANNQLHSAATKLKGAVGDVTQTLKVNQQAAKNLAAADGTATTKTSALQQALSHLAAYKAIPKVSINDTKARAAITQLNLAIAAIKQGKVPGLTANNGPGKSQVAQLQSAITLLKQGKVPSVGINNGSGKTSLANLQALINNLRQTHQPGVTANTTSGIGKLSNLQGLVNGLHGKTIYPVVDTSSAMSRLQTLLAAIPSGTFHFNVQADYAAHSAGIGSHYDGGWTKGPKNQVAGVVHGQEYVLSDAMLNGRQKVDSKVIAALSESQVRAATMGTSAAPSLLGPGSTSVAVSPTIRVFIGDTELTDIVRTEIGSTMDPLTTYSKQGGF